MDIDLVIFWARERYLIDWLIGKPDGKVVLGEVEALDAYGKVPLGFVPKQLVVNHSQVIGCRTTRLQHLLRGWARNWNNIFSCYCLKWLLSPPLIQIQVSHSDGFCTLGNGKRRASAGHWKKWTVSNILVRCSSVSGVTLVHYVTVSQSVMASTWVICFVKKGVILGHDSHT